MSGQRLGPTPPPPAAVMRGEGAGGWGSVARLASLLVLAALWGCGSQADDDVVTIRFWGMGREGEVVGELVPEFERQNPGIRVDVQQIPWSAAHEKVLTAFVGGATPDVAQLGNTWVPEFQALEALEDLGPWVGRSSVIEQAD